MQIYILTLFPEMFSGILGQSIIKRAREKEIVHFHFYNPRDFTKDLHRKVDDYPYGGGPGMVLKVEPISRAINFINENFLREGKSKKILLVPSGELLTQERLQELAKLEKLVLICGHYEGVDERIKFLIDEEISIGDYVLSGGEIPAMVLIDGIVRLLPSALGNEKAHQEESFISGLLEYPQYTRPREYEGLKVPEILLSGDHLKIKKWRRFQALKWTYKMRPHLLKRIKLTSEDEIMLAKIKKGEDEWN